MISFVSASKQNVLRFIHVCISLFHFIAQYEGIYRGLLLIFLLMNFCVVVSFCAIINKAVMNSDYTSLYVYT